MRDSLIFFDADLNEDGLPFRDIVIQRNDDSRVYIVEFDNQAVKIGLSRDPRERVRSLRTSRKNLGLPCRVSKAAMTIPHRGASDTERSMLRYFADHRLHGEYVDVPYLEAVRFLETLALRTEASSREIAGAKRSKKFFDDLREKAVPFMPLSGDQPVKQNEARNVQFMEMPERLRMVQQARSAYGPHAAQELWRSLGLPMTPSMRK